SGLSVNTATGLISGTPATAGTSTVTLNATNSGGTGTATLTLTINPASTAITYVQGNYAVPQTPQTTVSVTFSAAQTAGDLNVVVVGWNDSTASVTGITDTLGNKYKL